MKIRVVELFAGVGGFRVGLEGLPKKKNSPFEVVWSNQWEPSTKMQHASLVYQNVWPNANHSNEDIAKVPTSEIPPHDLLVGGFPCQDYSVATGLRNSQGLKGKKGVLWWQIERILKEKEDNRPDYLLLENVDRLLKSPASQRGRDFAIMLASLNALDYAVEWRVINAAEYGFAQRRKRVFIIGYRKGTELYSKISALADKKIWMESDGLFAKTFPVKKSSKTAHSEGIGESEVDITNSFNAEKPNKRSPFQSSGVMIHDRFYTLNFEPKFNGKKETLGDFVLPYEDVDPSFYVSQESINHPTKGWRYVKGEKKIERTAQNGHQYTFAEGKMVFPDLLSEPCRTIVTGEGGSSPSRFKHVIEQGGKYRRLTPIELEQLSGFPKNHTKLDGISDSKRAFFIGNALVVGIVRKLGMELASRIS